MLNLIITNKYNGIFTGKFQITDMFKYLVNNMDYCEIDVTEILNHSESEVNDIFIRKFGKLPDNIILFYTCYVNLAFLSIPSKIKTHAIVDDIHQENEHKENRIIGFRKCSSILATYGYAFNQFYDNIPATFFPYCTRFISAFNDKPINRVLVSGRLNKDIYPVRQMMYELSKKSKTIDYLKVNVGYRIEKDKPELIYGQRYIDYLSKYLICFTCEASDKRPYLVKKFFEIPGSGSLLLTINPVTKASFAQLGMIDGEHYISASTSDIVEKIRFLLDPCNRDMVDRIRKKGYEMIKANHTYIQRAHTLDEIVRSAKNS